ITNQSEIYRLKPEARSRLNSAYMTLCFVGGTLGSALSTIAYANYGWIGACTLGAIIGIVILVVWLVVSIRPKLYSVAAKINKLHRRHDSRLGI
ncbi:MAG: hypothetical protein ACREP9_07615, partial [Candidatus Dormibacteraceae bacterium]